MDTKLIKENLEAIEKIVSRWNDGEAVRSIERSLVLGKLADMYEQLLAQSDEVSTENPATPVPVETSVKTCEEITEQTDTSIIDTAAEPEHTIVLDSNFMFEYTPQFSSVSTDGEFKEEAVAGKRKMDRQKIRSLYEDDTTQSSSNEMPESPVASKPTRQPITEEEFPIETYSSRVLGEVINAGEHILGETIATGQSEDIATRIAADNVTNLRSSIGINDRFLMINDLFGGDEDAYDNTIEALEKFNDLDEALLYIHDNYKWRSDSDGAKLIIDLITRKLM